MELTLTHIVLAVTLYGITRVQDHELAMLGLVCRVAVGRERPERVSQDDSSGDA